MALPESISRILRRFHSLFKSTWHALEKIHTLLWIIGGSSGVAAIAANIPWVVAAYETHPYTVGITFGVMALLMVLLIVVAQSLFKYMALFERIGIVLTGGYPTDNKDEASKYRVEIRKVIDEDLKKSNKLRILGATGFNTFAAKGKEWQATPSAFLYETLENAGCDTKIEVILLHPASDYVHSRVNELNNITEEEYKKEIIDSIIRCAELKASNKKISCFLYMDRPPIWKLIISDNYVWQQAYPDGAHVEYSSVNLFVKKSDNKITVDNSLYTPFSRLFDLLRENCEEVKLDDMATELPRLKAM